MQWQKKCPHHPASAGAADSSSSSSLCHHCCHCPHAQLLCCRHHSCRKLVGPWWTGTGSILLVNLVSSATLIVIIIIVYERQWLSHNKLPPLVGYVLAGERAANIAIWITPVAAKSICGIFFASKNSDFMWGVACKLSPFFQKFPAKMMSHVLSHSMTDGATKFESSCIRWRMGLQSSRVGSIWFIHWNWAYQSWHRIV